MNSPMDVLTGVGEGFTRFNEGLNQASGYLEEQYPWMAELAKNAEQMTGGLVKDQPGPSDPDYTQHMAATKARREGVEALYGDSQTHDAMSVVGENLPTFLVPAARFASPVAVRMVVNGLTGAGTSATHFVEEGQSRGKNAIYGAIAGSVGGELARKLIIKGAQAVSALKGKMVSESDKVQAAYRALGDEVPEELRQKMAKEIVNGFTPKQAARKVDFESIGLNPTKGKVTDDPKALAMEDRLVNKLDDAEGLGDNIRLRATENNRALLDGLDGMVGQQGGKVDEAFDVGTSISAGVKKGKEQAHAATDEVYNAIRIEHGDKQVSLDGFAADMTDKIDFATQFKGIETLNNRLKRFGVIDDTGKVIKSVTVEQAENLRKLIGKLVGAEKDKFGQSQLISLKKSIENDIGAGVGKDAFAQARKVAADEFATFDNRKIVKAIMDGKLNPDNMIDRITARSWTSKDLSELVGTLEKTSPHNLNDLRSGLIRHIANKSTAGKTLNEFDDYLVSGANLLKEIDRIGKPKLRAILGEKDAMKLLRFAQTANKFTNKIPGTHNPSGTAGRIEQMVSMALKSARAVRGLPLVGNIADGWINAYHNKQLQKAAKDALNPASAIRKANKKAAKKVVADAVIQKGTGENAARGFRYYQIED